MSSTLHRQPALDGLRGIAILGVLLHHIDSRLATGGFVGVDVFFVLSGYLITSVIMRDVAAERFSFLHFYSRRAKRLVPAAVVMVAGVFCLSAVVLMPTDLAQLGGSAAAFAAMLSNVWFWRKSDYFAAQDAPWPLLHTWSLSIEEQFYLLYPLLLIWFAKSRWGWRGPITALAVASFAGSCLLTKTDPTAAYFSPFSRAWELLAGAIVSGLPGMRFGPRTATALGFAGLAAIVYPIAAFSDRTAFPGLAAALPVLATAGIIWLSQSNDGAWKRLLAHPALVWLGLVSYSLYLWHWPMIVLGRYLWSHDPLAYPTWGSWAAGVGAIGIAAISHRWIENRWRESCIPVTRAIVGAVGCSLFIAGLGASAYVLGGFPNRMPEPVRALLAAGDDVSTRRAETIEWPVSAIAAGQLPLLGLQDPTVPPAFALWGDSQADALVPVFDELAKRCGITGVALTRGATAPLRSQDVLITQPGDYPNDQVFTAAATDQLAKHQIPVVVLAACWSGYLNCDIHANGDEVTAAEKKCEAIAHALEETIAFLRHSGVHHIWIVGEAPPQPFSVPRSLALHALRGLPFPRGKTKAAHTAQAGLLEGKIARLAAEDVRLIDIATPILENPQGLVTAEGRPIYSDRIHLSVGGALWLGDILQPIFSDLCH